MVNESQTQESLKLLLRPALRYCLKNFISLPEIVRCAKAVLVELAADTLKQKGEPINTSRLSLLTGVHRKDVQQIRETGAPKEAKSLFAQRLLARWEQDPRFLTAGRRTRVLTCDGEGSQFWELVQCVSREMNPASVLSDLEHRGAIERTPHGVRLIYEYEELKKDPIAGFRLASNDAADLLDAARENLSIQGPSPHLHLRTEFDNIYLDKLPEIKAWLLLEGSRFHRRVRTYLSRFDKDLHPAKNAEAGGKVVVGAFSLTSEEKPLR
ncbi:MAG: hypothetical protein J0M12_08150 [Deltaproteobacteria bacterium]|nr:hypothetical protein [Deltaproteobacteria bacterium]